MSRVFFFPDANRVAVVTHLPVSPVSRKGTISSNVKAISPHFDFIFSRTRRRKFVLNALEHSVDFFMWFFVSLFLHQQAAICIAFHNIPPLL
jgi:hypothetical protein